MSKKRRMKQYRPGVALVNKGVAILQREGRNLVERVDYHKVRKLVNRETAIKYNRGIARELDLRNPAAIESELCDLFSTCVTKRPTDEYYPKLRSKTWRDMIGIRPTTRTPIGAFRDMVITMMRDIREAKRARTVANTHITETVNYLFARHMAHRYGHDKRGTPRAVNSAVDASLIHRGLTYTDDEGNTLADVIDPEGEAFIDQIERRLLLQQVTERITDPRDKATLEIYYRAFTKEDTTIEKEYLRQQRRYQRLGLRTPDSIRQRMHRVSQKYHLEKLNPYR